MRPTQEEVARALKTLDGVCVFAGIHGWTKTDPDLSKVYEWLIEEFRLTKPAVLGEDYKGKA